MPLLIVVGVVAVRVVGDSLVEAVHHDPSRRAVRMCI